MINKIGTMTASLSGVQRHHSRTRVFAFSIFALFLAPCHLAAAEVLRDPTRPPNVQSVTPGNAIEMARSGPQLQAIIIAENRRSAIISNRSVNMGDSIGGAQLIRINESEVVLRTGDRLQTLKLFPYSLKRTTPSDRQAMR